MPHKLKLLIAPLREAMGDFNEENVLGFLNQRTDSKVIFRCSHPIGTTYSVQDYYNSAYAPLLKAIPDLERRDTIVIAGLDQDGTEWVGTCGYYTGLFSNDWLDIPATGHQVHMRYHEFYRFQDGKIVEVHSIWDIVEVMMQADIWPMSPSLGREWHVPAPATMDGIVTKPFDQAISKQSTDHILAMLDDLCQHPENPDPKVMQLEKYWHPKMNWYGPSGIGTCRGMAAFRHWHQIPFLTAMPNRTKNSPNTNIHFFADHQYVAVTGWPNMRQTISADGWLGIAPSNQEITLCSLDFWRMENGKIKENWVLFDLLDIYMQLGVDVLQRMKERKKARNWGSQIEADAMKPLGDHHG